MSLSAVHPAAPAIRSEKARGSLDDVLCTGMHAEHTDLDSHVPTQTDRGPVRRARWAALGAAVAVTLGAGGLGLAHAGNNDQAAAYVAINPCRLADTRPDSPVGPHTGPIGPDTAISFTGHGDVPGTCNLPTNSTALELNVTAVGATQPTFLTIHPTGTPRPTASHLNPTPGAAAAPNSVTAALGTNGQFDVYNRFGNVHVIVDVVGYYVPTTASGTPGPAGPQGPQGPAGPKGAPGTLKVVVRNTGSIAPKGDNQQLFWTYRHCAPGEQAIHGGFQVVQDAPGPDPFTVVVSSYPIGPNHNFGTPDGENATGWRIAALRKNDTEAQEIRVYVLCATFE